MVDISTMLSPTVVLLVIVLSFVGAILSEKLRISYTTIMITIGLALSFLKISNELSAIVLDRTIILGLVVPPLIFEAAMRTKYQIFKTVRKTVLSLAIFGVIISAVLSGLVLNIALGLPLAVALTFARAPISRRQGCDVHMDKVKSPRVRTLRGLNLREF